MAESDLQRACLEYLKGRSDIWVLNVHGNPVQKGGVPDLLLCVRGRFVGIELKRPGETPTGRQRVTMRLIAKAGGHVAVIDSYDAFVREVTSI